MWLLAEIGHGQGFSIAVAGVLDVKERTFSRNPEFLTPNRENLRYAGISVQSGCQRTARTKSLLWESGTNCAMKREALTQ